VSKLNAAGSALTHSSYLSGSGADYWGGIEVDSEGSAYVVGPQLCEFSYYSSPPRYDMAARLCKVNCDP